MELLHSNKLAGSESAASTQKYVDVEEIKDGIVVLKNGSLRAVLMVSSINFDLKSTEEQDAIVAQYQNFLNSLDFPIEIVVNSRKLNIEPYLDTLKEAESRQTNELLRLQISEYTNFIKNLVEVSNIMSKNFYVVVPFSPIESKDSGIISKFSAIINPRQAVVQKRELFETYKNQIFQRVSHIIAGLSGSGVKVTLLRTEEVIELLYNSYNPTVHTNTIIKEIEKIELS